MLFIFILMSDHVEAAKYRVMGSDYVGVFATATDDFVFTGANLTGNIKAMLAKTLDARHIDMTVSASDLVGIFSRANSNGMLLSNLAMDYELHKLRAELKDMNIEIF